MCGPPSAFSLMKRIIDERSRPRKIVRISVLLVAAAQSLT